MENIPNITFKDIRELITESYRRGLLLGMVISIATFFIGLTL